MPVHACGSKCTREGTSSEADPARERCEPSSAADLIRGGLSPRARRTSLEGALCWAASVGRGGRHNVDRVVCIFGVRLEVGFAFCVFCRF
jgi:hypothetical protein